MWDKLQKAVQHPAAQLAKKICGDPVQLYAILLITSAMQYYHSSMNWLYTLLSVFLTLGLMKFYDFVAKHKYIGPVCYLAFLAAGLFSVHLITEIGWRGYPITFMVWFLTPQSVVEFSGWYTVAIYLLMVGFLSSAVYYFSKVRYRMVMQFLIMLIPMSLYAKEGIQMAAPLVILLLASYFLLMVYCRQLRETEEVRRLNGFHSTLSIAAYVMSFSILAAVVPKPTIRADREFIENAMAFSSWSDILMEAISMFTDTTDNSAMLTSNSRTIYYVNSPESLRLRTQTYTYYSADDSWSKMNDYDYPEYEYADVTFQKPQEVLQAILDAARTDAEFAAQYDLTETAGTALPEQEAQLLTIFTNLRGTNMIPAPTRIQSLNGNRQLETMVSAHGALTPAERTYGFRDVFYLDYYSDTYAQFAQVEAVLRALRQETYAALLQDAMEILTENGDEASAAILAEAYSEQAEAMEYLAYCEELDYQSEVIDALAAELTAGLSSDIEKARAIERYFEEMDYVYDLSYQKGEDDNVDTFLTESHTGICYEFATAMVLLCRSAGLPARYAQGYNLNELYDSSVNNIETNYVIKVRDAHGFPEVYISGYGWLSFEPTVAMDMALEGGTAENQYVMLWGLILLILALLAAGLYFLMPRIREQYFRRRISRMIAPQTASAVFCRMRKVLLLPESATVMELAEASAAFLRSEQAKALFVQLDLFLYDASAQSDTTQNPTETMTTQQLAGAYADWYADRKDYLKEQKRNEKNRKE